MSHFTDFQNPSQSYVGMNTFLFLDYTFRLDLEMRYFHELFNFSNPHDAFPSGMFHVGPRSEVSIQLFVHPKGRVNRKGDVTEYALQVSVIAFQQSVPMIFLSDVSVAIKDDINCENVLHKTPRVKLVKNMNKHICNRQPASAEGDEFGFDPFSVNDFEQPHKLPETYLQGDILYFIIRGTVHMPMLCRQNDIERLKRASTLTKNMALYEPFYNNELFSDLIVEMKGKKRLHGHRVVFATHSKRFTELFDEATKENFLNGKYLLKLTEYPAKEVEAAVKFMYAFSSKDFENTAKRLILVAETYKMPLLKELCENELIRSITVDNIVETFEAAGKSRAVKTMIVCTRFTQDNLKKMSTHDSFVTIDGKFVDDIVKMLQQMHINPNLEIVSKREK